MAASATDTPADRANVLHHYDVVLDQDDVSVIVFALALLGEVNPELVAQLEYLSNQFGGGQQFNHLRYMALVAKLNT